MPSVPATGHVETKLCALLSFTPDHMIIKKSFASPLSLFMLD